MMFFNKHKLWVIWVGVISLLVSPSGLSIYAAKDLQESTVTRRAPETVDFVEIANGLFFPTFITHAGDQTNRLFIVEKAGYIRVLKDGKLLSTPFLSINTLVSSMGEQGVLGLAFHPEYKNNGRFYIVYNNLSGDLVLARYLRSSTNPDQADVGSAVILMTIPKSHTNHNGGMLAFGGDGYLYWSTGDGGGAGDPDGNGQNLDSLLGKILRLDVSADVSYTVPPDNPYISVSDPLVRKEIWAYGLRNPWRFSFDRLTYDLYIGDVGQGEREEINFQPAGSTGGENYGWNIMEGSLCYVPSSGCNQYGKILPVAEYNHALGCSVTGGYALRGDMYPSMQGLYIYGDFCSGKIFALDNDPILGWISIQIADTSYAISTFGEDEDGRLYLADYSGGKIYEITFPTVLVNSILPTSRSTWVGNTVTVFNTVINAGSNTASGITLHMSVIPPAIPVGTFDYYQTNCATNVVIGPPNPVLNLPPGGVLCYLLSFTPIATFDPTTTHIYALAYNAPQTVLYPGVNTWLLRSTFAARPDIIALTTTTDFHQLSCYGANAFAVALSNVGASATGDITVSANTGSATLPVSVSIQETDPETGAIIGDNILQSMEAGANRTVAVFVIFNGCINFDPSDHRIFIELRDAENKIVGSTSTAVSTSR